MITASNNLRFNNDHFKRSWQIFVLLIFHPKHLSSIILKTTTPSTPCSPTPTLILWGSCCSVASLVFCVQFCRSLFVLLLFGHSIVCYFSIYGFCLPLRSIKINPRSQSGAWILIFFNCVLQIIVCPFSFGHCIVCHSSIYGF